MPGYSDDAYYGYGYRSYGASGYGAYGYGDAYGYGYGYGATYSAGGGYAGYGYGVAYSYGGGSSGYGGSYYSAVRNPAYKLTYPGETVSYSDTVRGATYDAYAHESADGTTYARLSTFLDSGEYLRSTSLQAPATADMRSGESTAYRLQPDGSSYYGRTTQSSYFYHPGELSVTDHYTLNVQADGASTAYESISYDHNYGHSVSIAKSYHSTYTDPSGYPSYSYGYRHTYLPPSGPNDEVVTSFHSP